MNKAVIAILAAIVVAAGGYFAFHKSPPASSNNQSSSSTSQNSAASNSDSQAPSQVQTAATITYTDGGFSPQTVTVKAGDKILIKNDSSSPMQFDSNPHPIHTDDPELNEGTIDAGSSAVITVTVKGTHGYHNHLDPSQTGTIIVQ